MAYTSPDARKQSLNEARNLTQALGSGWRPSALTVPIHLRPGEVCYAHGPAQVLQYLEGDGTYVHKSRAGFGMLGLAVVVGTAIGNKARASRAAQRAAPQFRQVDDGPLYLTDMRFAIQGRTQWIDLWHENIRMSSCDSDSISLDIADLPPIKLRIWPVDYYFALFRFLAHNEILQIPAEPG